MSTQTDVLWDKGTLQALKVFWRSDRVRVIHACKTALALTVGLGITMRLELGTPRTTMVSIVIVMMHQQVGMTIARGIYRLLGMLAGCAVALAMVAYLSQSFFAFYVALSCWTAWCVWGAFFFRNYQSYAFVLAGYATAIVAVPAWSDPYAIIDRIIYTASEVAIAVASASAVNAFIFPQSVGAAFFAAGQRHCGNLIGALRTLLAFSEPEAEMDSLHFKLNAERIDVEGLRSAAVFEDPELRQRTPLLREITSEFLDVTTTFHVIKQIRSRVKLLDDADDQDAVNRIAQRVLGVLPNVPDPGSLSSSDIDRTEKALEDCLNMSSPHAEDMPCTPSGAPTHAPAFCETFRVILSEAVADLATYLRLFAALREPPSSDARSPTLVRHAIRFSSTANRWAATAAAARALVVVAAVSSAWYISGWDNGSTAVTGAAITAALFATFPNPSRVSRQLFLGAVGGAVAASVFGFFILPQLDGFAMLAAALAPIIMFGSYLGSFPSLGPTGISFNIYFCYVANITNPATYDPTGLLDAGFAFCTGIGVAVIAFGVLIPADGAWMTRFYVWQMRRMVSSDACRKEIEPQSLHRFESGVRDYMVQVAAPAVPELARQWGFAVLDVGSAVIKIRDASLTQPSRLPTSWSSVIEPWRESMALLFEAVTPERHARAAASTRQAASLLADVSGEAMPPGHAWLGYVRAYLQVIEIELANTASPLHPASVGG
ncbi:FUSC family protein [Dyella sp. C11]|uniref:FUSC family protein n=1 Tax=Dyella sp. C11 TaxID=2126991 RepID=UPI000D65199A|nr:FUSC family protein [Dyella sp. C11]